jgi:nicotinate-nucleotide adenylyltransferase
VSCAAPSTSSRGTDTSAVEGPARDAGPAAHDEEPPTPARPGSIGILGGTFNPPHRGHLAIARHAHDELGLERVVLMPAHIPPHKLAEQDPGPEHRLAMCRLCIAGVDGLSVCALEIERGGPSYTVDTLQAIHSRQPNAQLTFILGADTASTLPAWREPVRMLELADLAVAGRTGSDREDVLETVEELLAAARPGVADRRPTAIRFLHMPAMDVSSSMARERAARGEEIDDLVGAAVAGYIREYGLYSSRTRVEG